MELFNRDDLQFKPLSERRSKTDVSSIINPNSAPPQLSSIEEYSQLEKIASCIKKSKEQNAPIVFAFGAHLVKNGLSSIMIDLMKRGYVQHILGNGAVSIHDWEFAFQGKTEEDVERYLSEGQFGLWEETGKYIVGAINQYPFEGYGTRIGRLISEEELNGRRISHPYKSFSILANAYQLNIPVSIVAQIGCDIIYTHPDCDGRSIGQASYVDFLKFVNTISNLENGTYISIGSAIASPMAFEKALSMARNKAKQQDRTINNFNIIVNDIQKGDWDWSKGEPPKNNPAYYHRFLKTFSRTGGKLQYLCMDNKAFLHNLHHLLV